MQTETVKMKYRTFKELYPKEPTIEGSYSSRDKTIDVVLDKEAAENYHMHVEEIEVKVPYWRFKKELGDYWTKKDSYNKDDKTIIIYMTISEAMGLELI